MQRRPEKGKNKNLNNNNSTWLRARMIAIIARRFRRSDKHSSGRTIRRRLDETRSEIHAGYGCSAAAFEILSRVVNRARACVILPLWYLSFRFGFDFFFFFLRFFRVTTTSAGPERVLDNNVSYFTGDWNRFLKRTGLNWIPVLRRFFRVFRFPFQFRRVTFKYIDSRTSYFRFRSLKPYCKHVKHGVTGFVLILNHKTFSNLFRFACLVFILYNTTGLKIVTKPRIAKTWSHSTTNSVNHSRWKIQSTKNV